MIRSSNGVRLLSSHLVRDSSRVFTISRVIGNGASRIFRVFGNRLQAASRMIRSSNGVRLLSWMYEGVFSRTLDSGVLTLSRVIGGGVGGHVTVNLNNSVLSNTSIRGSVSLSRADYERSPYTSFPGISHEPIDGVSEADFQAGFEDWCKCHDEVVSSEGEKDYMFKWFCDNHRYGRHFRTGGLPPHTCSGWMADIEPGTQFLYNNGDPIITKI